MNSRGTAAPAWRLGGPRLRGPGSRQLRVLRRTHKKKARLTKRKRWVTQAVAISAQLPETARPLRPKELLTSLQLLMLVSPSLPSKTPKPNQKKSGLRMTRYRPGRPLLPMSTDLGLIIASFRTSSMVAVSKTEMVKPECVCDQKLNLFSDLLVC